MIDNYLIEIICCPVCKSPLKNNNDRILECSHCGLTYHIDDDIPVLIPPETFRDIKEIIPVWDDIWDKTPMHDPKSVEKEEDILSAYKHVKTLWDKSGVENFLEAGCGSGRLLYLMGKNNIKVIGMDLSVSALKFCKKFLNKCGIKDFYLVCGDMRYMPFKDEKIGFIYGGGSIEHFEETQTAVSEIRRILMKDSIATLTYPYISIASLTYRQMYGNIAEFPVLKQIGKFIHITLLKKKLMRFGYEKSFFIGTMEKYYKKSGFKDINSGLFDTYLQIALFKSERIKNILRKMTSNRLFWPMVYTNGKK